MPHTPLPGSQRSGHSEAGVVLVNRTLNHRSVDRVSLEAGYRCDVAKKLGD
jgi:hypothetical protein